MTRPTTAPRQNPSGSTTVKIQRACNGCQRSLGDATDAELDAAMNGQPLPDVRGECGCYGLDLITAERQRQIAKGFDPDHDNAEHGWMTLASAAEAYLTGDERYLPWPTPDTFYDQTDAERLAKAGALIAAALDLHHRTGLEGA